MDFERPELRRDGGGASFYAPSVARYSSDAGLSRYDTGALGCTSERDPMRPLSYHTDSAFLGSDIGSPGPSVGSPELENRRLSLREIADRTELSHYRMLEEHDRRALVAAELAPYTRHIPLYPKLSPENGQINCTAPMVRCTRSLEKLASRSEVQKDLNLGPRCGPLAQDAWLHERPAHDSILQNRVTGYNVMLLPQVMREPPPPFAVPVPVQVPTIEKKVQSSAGNNKKRKKEYGQEVIAVKPTVAWSKWPCVWCSVNFDSKEAMDAHFQEKHQVCNGDGPTESEKVEKSGSGEARTGLAVENEGHQKEKVQSSANNDKKRKKEYGQEVIAVKPTVAWSKWPCVWCSVNFDSKEAMDAHFQEKHQVCNGDGPTESEKVEKNGSGEARTSLAIENEGRQKEIYEASGPHTTKKMQIVLPPSDLKQKSDKQNREEVVPSPENREIAGSYTNKKIKLDLPPSNLKQKSNEPNNNKEEVVPTPENKEIAGSYANKKIKLDLPPSNLKQKSNEPNKEEVVPTPENKEITGCSTNKTIQLHLPSLDLKQKSFKPNDEVLPTPEKKDTVGSTTHTTTGHEKEPAIGMTKPGGWFCGLCKINTLTKTTLNEHFQSNAHLENLKELNGFQKSKPANKLVQKKPIQEASQAVSVPKLEEPKEETSKSIPMPQTEKLNEDTSQDRGIPSSSNGILIQTGHKKIAQPIPKFSHKQNYAPVTGTTEPFLVMKEHKWFCNLCQVKYMCETTKEAHIYGKRHKQNLQAQGVSVSMPQSDKLKEDTPEDKGNPSSSNGILIHTAQRKIAQPTPKFSDKQNFVPVTSTTDPFLVMKEGKWFCNLCQVKYMPEAFKEAHINGKRHKQNLQDQGVSVPKLEEPKEETSKSVSMPQLDKLKEDTPDDKGNPGSSNGILIHTAHRKIERPNPNFSNKQNFAPVTTTTDPFLVMKEGKWFCNLCQVKCMYEAIKEAHINGKRHKQNLPAQGVSVPKLEEPKEETSKSVSMPQLDKLKDDTPEDKGNPSSSNGILIHTAHKKIERPTPNFSNKQNFAPVASTTDPFLVMKEGRWFCNLCQVKYMSEKVKEAHFNGKRHKQNLQDQAVSHKPEPNKPPANLYRCFICNLNCYGQENLLGHIKGKKHREAVIKRVTGHQG